jgi:transcriptional regulator with XRE-family HTH domain
MTTRKSDAVKILEGIAGRVLNFGGLIESLRLAEEKTQASFAKVLRISPSHLCDIEKGRKAVSAARAAEFARALKRSEILFVKLALQDELTRSGLKMKVQVEAS